MGAARHISEEEYLNAFEQYADALFRHAYLRVATREKARDLAQDTFIKAWDYLAGGGRVQDWKGFLYRTLHNLIVDEYRKKKSSSLDSLLEEHPEAEAAFAGDGKEIEEALDTKMLLERVREQLPYLPEEYRAILTLRFFDGLEIREIAETTGLSENLVSVRLHRGLARLRTLCTT